MSELELVHKPDEIEKVYLCRLCRWHGFNPEKHTFGGGGYWFTHVICPQCDNVMRRTNNL
jgi:hypothetical protein